MALPSTEISATEERIVGQWVLVGEKIQADQNAARIEELIERHLECVATDPSSGGWVTLFRDPKTGDYWERVYLQSELHGGGPPSLIRTDAIAARRKYGLV